MKLIHAADIHLDSPLRGLERYEGAPTEALRAATRRALENLVDLALDESVVGVLLAGDLYDGDWKDYNTGLFFARQMERLRRILPGLARRTRLLEQLNATRHRPPAPRRFQRAKIAVEYRQLEQSQSLRDADRWVFVHALQ